MEQSKTDDFETDRVVETYAGKKILITGGTGFLGKVMLEKFLRCLPDIAHIYVLVRSKHGKDPKHRLDEIYNSPVSLLSPFALSKNGAKIRRQTRCTIKEVLSPRRIFSPINFAPSVYHREHLIWFPEKKKKKFHVPPWSPSESTEKRKCVTMTLLLRRELHHYCLTDDDGAWCSWEVL